MNFNTRTTLFLAGFAALGTFPIGCGSSAAPHDSTTGGASQVPNHQGGSSNPGLDGSGGEGPMSSQTGGNNGAQGGTKTASQGGTASTSHPTATGGASKPPATGVAPSSTGFLHVEGNQLLDDAGHPARLTGVNWFGFETSNLSPHGLWARDYRSMLEQIRDIGFNTVRIPWCDAMLADGAKAVSVNTYGADPYDHNDPMNGPLEGKTPLQIMDLIVETAGQLKLKIILDNHSRKPDGYMEEQLWYTDTVSEEKWISNWVFMAEHFRGNPTIVAFDLDNEPHGKATWAAGDAATDWNLAAERCGKAIQAVNSDALIIIEGVEKVNGDPYWWGSNLSAVRAHPITLSKQNKLVYSAHEYGPEVFAQPWFTEAAFPANMASIWDAHFGYLMKESKGHVFIGEFGIKDRNAASGASGKWFDTFLGYAGSSYSWTFWCWNPNSGDTEGILAYDWLTPAQWKLDAIKPHLAPQFQ